MTLLPVEPVLTALWLDIALATQEGLIVDGLVFVFQHLVVVLDPNKSSRTYYSPRHCARAAAFKPLRVCEPHALLDAEPTFS
jgi:hypothetical protein